MFACWTFTTACFIPIAWNQFGDIAFSLWCSKKKILQRWKDGDPLLYWKLLTISATMIHGPIECDFGCRATSWSNWFSSPERNWTCFCRFLVLLCEGFRLGSKSLVCQPGLVENFDRTKHIVLFSALELVPFPYIQILKRMTLNQLVPYARAGLLIFCVVWHREMFRVPCFFFGGVKFAVSKRKSRVTTEWIWLET